MEHTIAPALRTTPHSPGSCYSGPTAEDLNHIPAVLKARRQWLLWRGEDRLDEKTGELKLNKIPINPHTLRNADTTDPATWGSYEHCIEAMPVALEGWEHEHPATYRGGGLGFVFTADDPYCGIDLDRCRNVDTGDIEPWAKERIEHLDSYTETTPSSTGLHSIVEASLPPHGRRKGHVEMYDYARFFTMTGWHLPGTPPTIEPRQAALTAFHTAVFGRTKRAPAGGSMPTTAPTVDDTALLEKARAAKNGPKFTALWSGDTSAHDHDDSSADLALCCMLAFWTQDPAQIDRLFRHSGLIRDKWDEKRGAQTYGERTIAEALARQSEHYRPRRTATPQAPKTGNNPQTDSRPAAASRPDIFLNTEMTRIVDETQAALLALPEAPIIFQRARHLAVIARGVKPPKWLHRPQDMPVILDASTARLTELASQAAEYWKWDKREEDWQLALPPKWVIETLQSRHTWHFPLLEGIVTSPTLRPDGSLLDVPGYDAETGLYLDMGGTTFPPLPARPTLDDARSAIGHVQEAVTDFPFTDTWHFSATLAAMLSLVCRFAVMGNVPLFAIRANTPGSGKGLLADVISIIGTGRAAPRWPQVTEDEEERKRLLTVALAGDPCLHIDNVTRPLGSPALDMALTAPSFSDRILGKHESREAPLSMVWLASGNNMQFHGDTARRIVPIDLDPKMEKPEERINFTHDPLTPWVQRQRPRLTMAALTIVKAYFEAGCPAQGLTPMGSFEQWSDLIRQAVVWAGEPDPNEGRKDLQAASNPEYEQLAILLDAWAQCYPKHDAWTLAQVKGDIQVRTTVPPQPPNTWNALQEALGTCDPKYDGKSLNTKTLGYTLRKFEGRTIAGQRFVTAGKLHQAQRWRVEPL